MGTAPPGALQPAAGGPLWRDTLNMGIFDGLLKRRGATEQWAYSLPSATYKMRSSAENEQPLLIISNSVPGTVPASVSTNPPCGDISAPPTAAVMVAVITSRQAFVYNEAAGGWVNVTPTYTTGTITATNGSANVTGAGTAWATRGISPYQHILIDGTWYQVCTVTSDTAMTISPVFAGGTGGGKAYTIRRNWNAHSVTGERNEASLISVELFNQNLYIGGRFIGRGDGQVSPALIKVSDCLGAAPTTAYLTGSFAYTAGLDIITGLTDITGVKALQDGRVVFSGAGTSGPSTIFYSSNVNQAVWTVAPGGASAVVYKEGAIHALGRIGKVLTLHYESGVVLGYPTNQADPPLDFEPSGATEGCYAPHTLLALGGREYYSTNAGNVAMFDLSASRLIGDDPRKTLLLDQASDTYKLRTLFAGYNPNRNEYVLFVGGALAGGYQGTYSALRLEDGSWWPGQFAGPITAAATSAQDGSFIIGAKSLNGAAATSLLWRLNEGAITDTLSFTGGNPAYSQAAIRAETDDLDFGEPLNYKTLVSVVVWFRATTGTPPITETVDVSASIDGGGTWTTVSKSVTAALTGETPVQFSFLDLVNASHQIRIRIGPQSTLTSKFAYSRKLITVNMGGDLRQVEL